MATTAEYYQLDPTIWKACAGNSVKIPAVDSRVYYFPQGHAEQSSSVAFFSPLVSSQPSILCRVVDVRFLANPETDEVFCKIRLVPIDRRSRDIHVRRTTSIDIADGGDEEKVASFAKILTPSDANNGGGFSVPRFCADSIFPALDYAVDPPVQNLLIRDVQGTVWDFRHIYRGTPRRHLLTTGWSKFVNHKKLIAGDSVVFMRNTHSGELFVGVRRAVRSNADCGGRWNCPAGLVRVKAEVLEEREGFSRSGRGRVSAESVAEAAEFAAQGMGFEIVCYPRASGWADFVVKAETVEESLNVIWTAGTRVKMAMETEDSSRMTWFQGTVSAAYMPDNGPWRGSPWRMLQVTWDEPEVLQNVKRVSPWQVEYVVPTPTLHSAFPPSKKFRVLQNHPGFFTDGEREMFIPSTELSHSVMANLNPSWMGYDSLPAGMQGARQDPCVSSVSNFMSEDAHQIYTENNIFGDMQKLKAVSTKLQIGSSESDDRSPDSQGSVHFFGAQLAGKRGFNSSEKVGIASIRLFGNIIYQKEPAESGSNDVGIAETEGVNNTLGLTYPRTKLFDRLDVQCQRAASAVNACLL